MNSIQIFENPEFGQVRIIVDEKSNPYFCLVDLCNALDLNSSKVVQRLEDDVLSKYPISDNLGRQQDTNFVSEEGFYEVVLNSRKENVKPFKKWVTGEVLPSIRKTGSYSVQQKLPQTYKEALIELLAKVEENEKLQIENTELKPKGEFYDAVAGSDTLIDMNQVSKTLNVKGLGRNKLFEFLRSQKILMNDNQPYQQYVDKGYFKLIEVRWTNPKTGDTNITLKTMVFQTGLDFIRKTVKKYYK